MPSLTSAIFDRERQKYRQASLEVAKTCIMFVQLERRCPLFCYEAFENTSRYTFHQIAVADFVGYILAALP